MGALDVLCGHCVACGRVVRVGAVLYTAEARPLCPLCFTKADVIAARRPAGFDRGPVALLGAAGVAVPFALHAGWIALVGGALGLLAGTSTLRAGRSLASARWLGLGALVVALGVYHLAWAAGWSS